MEEQMKLLKHIKDNMPSGLLTFLVFCLLLQTCDTNKKLDKLIEIQSNK